MREIKFRAWYPNKKRFIDKLDNITDHLMDIKNGKLVLNVYELANEDTTNIEYFNDDSYILMQYTGLKDKNGVEIYEGDILKQISSENESILHIVKYDDNEAKFIANNIKLGNDYTCGISKDWILKKEVIGNIYKNKDLLKDIK